MKKRIIAMLMGLVLIMSILPISAMAADVVASGKCGENVTWKLTDDGKMTISGEGEINVYDSNNSDLWYNYRDQITSVVINEGVTGIYDRAFGLCSNLTTVTFPESLLSIGTQAFYMCDDLKEIKITAGVAEIGQDAFNFCFDLERFSVDENNQHYSSENGVLYSKDKSTLIQAPPSGIFGEFSVPAEVKYIGYYSFCYCEELTEITLPEGLLGIEEGAFSACGSLRSISFPDSMTSIGAYAFHWCDNLENINISASVINIENNAFNECKNVVAITVDEDNQHYSSDTHGVLFNKDKSILMWAPQKGLIGSYTIPATVSVIDAYAFDGCSYLTDITIPYGVTAIEQAAFSDCFNLADITIPNSVTSIGANAFSGCDKLTTIKIPASVIYVDDSAFFSNPNMLKIVVADDNPNYSSDARGAFLNKDKTELFYVPEGLVGAYTVPASVSRIAENALRYTDYLNTIYFVGNAPEIASYEILRDKTVFYPYYDTTWTDDVLDRINEYVEMLIAYDPDAPLEGFDGKCGEKLTWELSLDGVLTISGEGEMYDFEYDMSPWAEHKYSISTVALEKGITKIGEKAFCLCYNLREVSIPNTVKSIGHGAFQECFKLSEINIPASVDYIAESAFNYCIIMTDFHVDVENQNYSSDENGNLYNKDKTELIKVPCGYRDIYTVAAGVEKIGGNAFTGCERVTYIEIPASVTYINEFAFNNCDSLRGIVVDEGNQNYTSDERAALLNKEKTELIKVPTVVTGNYTIPEGVVTLCYEAVRGCEIITSITIPASLKEIHNIKGCSSLTEYVVDSDNPYFSSENGLLYNKDKSVLVSVPEGSIGEVVIPANVKSIAPNALLYCINVNTVRFEGNAPAVDAVYGIYWDMTAYYPANDPTWTEEIMMGFGDTVTWIPYTSTNRPQGDVDGSGELTNADLIMVARYIVELYSPETVDAIEQYGDMDGDSKITNADLISIARIIVGIN